MSITRCKRVCVEWKSLDISIWREMAIVKSFPISGLPKDDFGSPDVSGTDPHRRRFDALRLLADGLKVGEDHGQARLDLSCFLQRVHPEPDADVLRSLVEQVFECCDFIRHHRH